MFRFVSEGARSVGAFVAKVLSPRGGTDHGTQSELDTALSSSPMEERVEEATADSPAGKHPDLIRTPNVALRGGEERPESPKLSPPTPEVGPNEEGTKLSGGGGSPGTPKGGAKTGAKSSPKKREGRKRAAEGGEKPEPKRSKRGGGQVQEGWYKKLSEGVMEPAVKREKKRMPKAQLPDALGKKKMAGVVKGGSEIEGMETPQKKVKETPKKERKVSEIVAKQTPKSAQNSNGEKKKGTPKATPAKKEAKKTPRTKGTAKEAGEGGSAAGEISTPLKKVTGKRKGEEAGATPGGGKAKAPKKAGGNAGKELIGKRIKVLWEKGIVEGVDKDTWYVGMVTSYTPKTRLHGIQYDDGDFEEEDLSHKTTTVFEFLS